MPKNQKITDYKKEFEKGFNSLCYSRSPYAVWADLMALYATSIQNQCTLHYKSIPELKSVWEGREKTYLTVINKYKKAEQELICEMFAYLVLEFEKSPYQDLLGSMYMLLGISNGNAGQFFTPYSVCQLMGNIVTDHSKMRKQVKEHGYFECNDCAVGGGATLIGFAETCNKEFKRLDYKNHVLFVGQDIDITCVHMCYIQLSLLGLAGYVIHGNTLTEPTVDFMKDNARIWITPHYNGTVWQQRVLFHHKGLLL